MGEELCPEPGDTTRGSADSSSSRQSVFPIERGPSIFQASHSRRWPFRTAPLEAPQNSIGHGPCTLQASHPQHWPLRMAPSEAQQRVVLGGAPTGQASHPRHWPLRLAPLEAPQRVVLGGAPTPVRPLILGTGHSGWLS